MDAARMGRVALAGVLLAMMVGSLTILDGRAKAPESQERLYFPSGRFLVESSVGFREAMADYLWFRFIQYYGAFAKGFNDLRYFDLLIDGITRLDPSFVEAYHFASLVAWSDFGDFAKSYDVLKRGILHNPGNARLHFTVGFMYYVFQQDYPRAALWFEQAGECPDATDRERRFAACARLGGGDDTVSLELWKTLLESTSNPQMKDLAAAMIEKITRHITIQRTYGPDFIGPIPELRP